MYKWHWLKIMGDQNQTHVGTNSVIEINHRNQWEGQNPKKGGMKATKKYAYIYNIL